MAFDKSKFNFIKKIKDNKKLHYILIVILAIIAIILSIFSWGIKSKNTDNLDEVGAYVVDLESRLCETLNKIDGVGKVSVMISVKSGMETVLAMKTTITETANGKEIVETPILVNGKTVVLKENYPEISGVIIVAEGAKSIAVLNKIQSATVSLLDINVNQIEILTMK